jgi:hypothetical protein
MDGLDLRMAEGIAALFPAISTPAHNFPIPDNDAAHRDFPIVCCLPGQGQCLGHKFSFCHIHHL